MKFDDFNRKERDFLYGLVSKPFPQNKMLAVLDRKEKALGILYRFKQDYSEHREDAEMTRREFEIVEDYIRDNDF